MVPAMTARVEMITPVPGTAGTSRHDTAGTPTIGPPRAVMPGGASPGRTRGVVRVAATVARSLARAVGSAPVGRTRGGPAMRAAGMSRGATTGARTRAQVGSGAGPTVRVRTARPPAPVGATGAATARAARTAVTDVRPTVAVATAPATSGTEQTAAPTTCGRAAAAVPGATNGTGRPVAGRSTPATVVTPATGVAQATGATPAAAVALRVAGTGALTAAVVPPEAGAGALTSVTTVVGVRNPAPAAPPAARTGPGTTDAAPTHVRTAAGTVRASAGTTATAGRPVPTVRMPQAGRVPGGRTVRGPMRKDLEAAHLAIVTPVPGAPPLPLRAEWPHQATAPGPVIVRTGRTGHPRTGVDPPPTVSVRRRRPAASPRRTGPIGVAPVTTCGPLHRRATRAAT